MENQKNENNLLKVKQKSGNDVKDTLFRKLFSEKERAIELCNALEETDYPPNADAMICNLDDSVVRGDEGNLQGKATQTPNTKVLCSL